MHLFGFICSQLVHDKLNRLLSCLKNRVHRSFIIVSVYILFFLSSSIFSFWLTPLHSPYSQSAKIFVLLLLLLFFFVDRRALCLRPFLRPRSCYIESVDESPFFFFSDLVCACVCALTKNYCVIRFLSVIYTYSNTSSDINT